MLVGEASLIHVALTISQQVGGSGFLKPATLVLRSPSLLPTSISARPVVLFSQITCIELDSRTAISNSII